ncbi:MAG: AmmeMemoRadiSam system protein B [Elusimicrobia bacterium]|nr:AmmeMemoRadiSam system protein B [Elusimicrobiota bacterium]
MLRQPQFAGTWYPDTPDGVSAYLDGEGHPGPAIAAICPHAGWMYSGRVAGAVYARLFPADTYVLVGPNHTGLGVPVSLYAKGTWLVPGARLPIDEELAARLLEYSEFIQPDVLAHTREHCLEVQLPFIAHANPDARIVPLVLMHQDAEICQDVGRSLIRAIRQTARRRVLLIASTDFTHYEPYRLAKVKDQCAIDSILALDPGGLLQTCKRMGISMCGAGPTAAVLQAARALGAIKADLICYATSGDVSEDYSSVVGYAGLTLA